MATIVVAEDDVHITRVVTMWLRLHDHTVYETMNGRDALKMVCQHRPEVLLTDVNMPLMDGVELVAACAAEGLPKVGTVVLTSRCDQEEIREKLKGYQVVLHAKPFSPSRLIAEVEKLISAGGSAEANEGALLSGEIE